MKSVIIDPDVLKAIEYHAHTSRIVEIYGWLVGTEDSENQYLSGYYSCHKYLVQTTVNAKPDPVELNTMELALPIGLVNLGQYHSHPNRVFHSLTDDDKVLQIAKMYPEVISIVSNGSETRCYKVNGNKTQEVDFTIKTVNKRFEVLHLVGSAIVGKAKLLASFDKLFAEVKSKIPSQIDPTINIGQIDLGGSSTIDINMEIAYLVPVLPNWIDHLRDTFYVACREAMQNGEIRCQVEPNYQIPLTLSAGSLARDTMPDRLALFAEIPSK